MAATESHQCPAALNEQTLSDTRDWLVERALGRVDLPTLIAEFAVRLNAAGFQLWRVNASFKVLHPNFEGSGVVWKRGEGVQAENFFAADEPRQVWLDSPLKHVLDNHLWEFRARLGDGDNEALARFPILREWRDAGMTDYLIKCTSFDDQDIVDEETDGMLTTYLTDRPDGFTEAELAALDRVQPRLGVAVKVAVREQVVRNVLDAYLGPSAGREVLDGKITVGSGKRIEAVIWMADLRGSTGLSEALPPDRYLALLNRYFACTAGAVVQAGGEVLLLPGDGVVAIFPIEGGADQACRRGLDAALEAQRRMAAWSAERAAVGEPPLGCVVALHLGEFTFGNVGVSERVEFTVIGPSANEASRMEEVAKREDAPIVASKAFAGLVEAPWRSLGTHQLRGLSRANEVFAYPLFSAD